MGYLHIENLYRPEAQELLTKPECYALEKIHGTSAHVRWNGTAVSLFSGGEKHDNFAPLFDLDTLASRFARQVADSPAVVYGEAYGGKQQGMRDTYGDRTRFVAFDVQVGDLWLPVPEADAYVLTLGLEFVAYARIPTTLTAIDAERDRPSVQALRNGILEPKIREGVVLRPVEECVNRFGRRIIAKHKRAEFFETKTARQVDPSKLAVLQEARAIADEWVTEMRLSHVLDKLGNPTELSATGNVVRAMIEDVLREGSGELVDSQDTKKAIGTAAARMFKARVTTVRA